MAKTGQLAKSCQMETEMSLHREQRRCAAPTFIVSVVLAGLCLAGAVFLSRVPAALSETTRALLWALLSVALITAIAGSALAWKNARRFHRSFQELAARVRAAAPKLGRSVPDLDSTPEGLSAQVGALVNGIDQIIEERQQREREVMRSDQLAMVGQIAAGVAHELRNPLTSVKMLIQTNLKEAGDRGFPTEDLEIIEQEIRRMEKCLQLFLDFARPPKPERRPIDLALLVERTLALVEGRARKQHVALRFVQPPSTVVVEADEDQIQQLLLNLVLNALDAMPEGGSIDIRVDSTEDGLAELHVLDNGPGIPDDLFPRLFDPFVSTKETGIGLGLAVSHRIARNHGGTLSAVNRREGGTHFTLRLPATEPSLANA